MSLNGEIQALVSQARTNAPAGAFETLGNIFARLTAENVATVIPRPGDQVPDVTFIGEDGKRVLIASLYVEQPLVLLFYRGRWCPFCDLTLRAYERARADFDAAGARLIAVSPQTLEQSALTGSERNLSYPLLTDPQNAAARAFGLHWQVHEGAERDFYRTFGSHVDQANGDDSWELPAPAVFVIDRNGIVRWAWADSNWTNRAEPAEVLAAVHAVTTHP